MAGWVVPVTLHAVYWLSLLPLALCQDIATGGNATNPTPNTGLTNSQLLAAILVPSIIGGIILIGLLAFIFLKVREKRQTEGTYRPSSEEQVGSRVETSNALKLPPEERLI